MSSNYLQLIDLIESYLSLNLSSPDFEKLYIKIWRKYRDFDNKELLTKETQDFLDLVFCALDVYCYDPSLRSDENDLDEESLYLEVKKFYKNWKEIK